MKFPLLVAGAVLASAAVAAAVRSHGSPHAAALADHSLAGSPPVVAGLAPAAPVASPSPTRVVVYVAGAVRHAGVYALASGSRVDAALRAASGPAADADMLAVNLAAPLEDGEKILVPPKGAARELAYAADASSPDTYTPRRRRRHRGSATAGSPRSSRHHRSRKAPPSSPIDINAADAATLEQLPGIGAGLAERIIAFRDANGAFHTADDLLDVAGMTDRRYEEIVPYVVVR